MKKLLARLEKAAEWLDDEPGDVPVYDPVGLGAVLIGTMVVVGALYWLLWTLLVYEGGIAARLEALARWAAGADPGPDAFDGWLGNAGALVLCALSLAALHRLFFQIRKSAKN